jgi:hypothetical protein
LFFHRCGAVFFGQHLQDADRCDIVRNLLLRRTLADPELAPYAEVEACAVTPPCCLFVRS